MPNFVISHAQRLATRATILVSFERSLQSTPPGVRRRRVQIMDGIAGCQSLDTFKQAANWRSEHMWWSTLLLLFVAFVSSLCHLLPPHLVSQACHSLEHHPLQVLCVPEEDHTISLHNFALRCAHVLSFASQCLHRYNIYVQASAENGKLCTADAAFKLCFTRQTRCSVQVRLTILNTISKNLSDAASHAPSKL